jgi:hypothetical protein
MASLAGVTFVWPGTTLDRVWVLNPRAYRELAPYGKVVGFPFLLLGATLAIASLGWFKRRLWGWRLAVIVIGTQVSGDLVNIFLGRILEGTVGVAIAGVLFLYLLRAKVRARFGTKTNYPQK